jgi:metallo-beta-lactamase class B
VRLLAATLAGLGITALLVLASPRSSPEDAALKKQWKAWNEPRKPFRIIGNIHYVGPQSVSSFLITTPEGHILIDTGFDMSVARIRKSVTQLGFELQDIEIILSSHAHLDHVGGHSAMKELTGAEIWMSEADAALLATGGTDDFTPFSLEMKAYPPAKADRILADGERVTLGGTTLTCHLTPGHTKGTTTWTMEVEEAGQRYAVVFFGSTSILPGVSLVDNPRYPRIAQDLRESYAKLEGLPCDVFLAPHGSFFDLDDKAARLSRGEQPNPFIDPGAYRTFVEKAERSFLDQLGEQLGGRFPNRP